MVLQVPGIYRGESSSARWPSAPPAHSARAAPEVSAGQDELVTWVFCALHLKG